MRLTITVFILFCALVSKDAKAQNSNWQGISPWTQFFYTTHTFYEDTAADLLYIGQNKVSSYDGTDLTQMPSLSFSGGVRHIIKFQDTLYASAFDIGFELMKWNGSSWDTSGFSTDGPVSALYVYGGELYVGGWFTTIGGINANCLAKFDGTNWSTIGTLPVGYNYGITAITMYNGELYIGGNFGDSAWNTMNILRWNGTQWNTVGGGFHGNMDEVSALEVYNNILYIGGSFIVAHGNVGNYIAKWDGNTLSDVGGGVMGISNGQICDLMTFNNSLYAVGLFSYAGGIFADHIAKWDGTNWCGFGDTLISNTIRALGTYRGELYIGGAFDTISNDTISSIAKWIGGNYVDTCANMTGVEENNSTNFSVQVFPNPVSDKAVFKFSDTNQSRTVSIYDQLGQEIWRKETIENQIEFSVEGIATGLYFYRVEGNEQMITQGKFIVQ